MTPEPQFGMAVTYEGGDAAFLEQLVSLVDYIEVSPDGMARKADRAAMLDEVSLDNIRGLAKGKKVLAHGVGLSMGSVSGWNEDYFHLLDGLLPHVDCAWHSEHLGFTASEQT